MTRFPRKYAISLGEVLSEVLAHSPIAKGLNSHLVFSAWDKVSGAGNYTIRRFFRDGKLYITLSSSVVRSQLLIQRTILLEKINALLEKEDLLNKGPCVKPYVKELILK